MAKTTSGLYRRGGIWWVRTDPITGKPRSTKCRDKEAALLVRASREREAADPAHAAATKETLSDACVRLIDARQAIGKPTGYYVQKLGHWLRIFGDDRKLAGFGPAEFDEFVRQRRTEGVTDHTIGKEVRCMGTVLRLAKRVGRYAGDLAVLRPMDLTGGYVPRTRALPPHELMALLAQLEPKRWAFVALSVGLGLRRGEVYRLQPADLDFVLGIAHVRGTKTAGALRTIPILAPFRGLLESAAKQLPVPNWNNYLRDLRLACAKAGIATVTANDLRRTHATLLRSAGVDRDVARRLLGHAAQSTMLETVYDQPTPHELAVRAGDLGGLTATLSLQSPPSESQSKRAPQDSNLRPTAPEAVPGTNGAGEEAKTARKEGVTDGGGRRTRLATDTESLHSIGVWAIALVAAELRIRPRELANA